MSKQINDLRARYNASGNAVIPNTFQHPNIFIDKLMHYLTPEENTGLTFAVRRILGFQTNIMSRKDNISLSQFTDGITAEDGHMLSMGCGMGVNTVRSVLDSLEKYRILVPTTDKPNPVKGQEYWLQDNENNIDWEGLEDRKNKRAVEYQKRTKKATKNSLISRGYVARKGNVGRKTPVTSDVIEGVTSDVNTKPTETHGNPPNDNDAENRAIAERWELIETLYRENVTQKIVPIMSQVLLNIAKTYEDSSWYEPAFVIYVKNTTDEHGVGSFDYFEKILATWKEKGRDWKPEKKQTQTKPTEPKGFDAVRKFLANHQEEAFTNG